MSTHPAQNTQERWPFIVPGATFLITIVTPLLVGAVFSNILGGWTINSLIRDLRQPSTPGEALLLLGIFLAMPILISLLTFYLWKRMLRSGKAITAGRGLFTFFLADLLAGISGFLLATITVLLPAIFIFNNVALGWLWLILCIIILSQTVYSLPFLLLAGALIARWQARQG